jgi:Ca-activated chloride channel family protein
MNAMKLSPDSPELTAYALGELTPAERAAVEAALADAPELRAELDALRHTADLLAHEFAAEPAVELSPGQRATIVQNAGRPGAKAEAEPDPARPPLATLLWERFQTWRASLAWAVAAVAVLALTLAWWPKPRDLEHRFAQLRYQPDFSPAPAAQPHAPSNAPAVPFAVKYELADKQSAANSILGVPAVATASAPPQSGAAQAPALDASAKTPMGGGAKRDLNRFGMQNGQDAPVAVGQTWNLAGAPVSATDALTPSAAAPADTYAKSAAVAPAEAPAVRVLSSAADGRANALAPSSAGGITAAPLNGGLAHEPLSKGKPAAASPLSARYARWPEAEGRKEVELGRAVQLAEATPALQEHLVREKEVVLQQLADRSDAAAKLFYRVPSGGLAGLGTEAYAPVTDNPFKEVTSAPLSTFGMDVDTGSYANLRRFLRGGSLPPPDAVRLEELINYFHYDYPPPHGDDPFSATVEIATCPWDETHKLARVGIRAKDLAKGERPRANLVFLLDVSGSMEPENKLPLVKRSMRLLLDKLTPRDTVGIVTYAGDAKIALEPVAITPDGRQRVTDVLEGLRAGSGTHGSAGIQNAYAMATNHFAKEGVNRVILCTDGDFNIGITDQNELLNLITQEAKSGVFLSVLGFGMDNLKDVTMETLADKGNGNYAYIDSFSEARKVLVEQLDGTLVTVAKDAKVQVEFNPARVTSYRLLGYEKRLLRDRDFNDDTKDAGEVGAGHSVTVLYEIVLTGPNLAGVDPLRYGEKKGDPETAGRATVKPVHTDELLNLKLRYKQPDGEKSRLIEQPVKDAAREFGQAGSDFKFAAAVAGYGMLLRNSPHKGDLTWEKVLRLAEQGLGEDKEGYRAEFVDLARTAQKLSGGK